MLNFNFINLTTDRLILRALKNEDADNIFRLRSDDRVNQYLNRPKTVDISEALNFIKKIITNNQAMYWAIALKNDDILIGTICLWNIVVEDHIAEIGYELMPHMQGKGIMQEAISAVIKFGFEDIGLRTITALPHPLNTPSIKILERNGFKLDAYFNYCPKDELNGLACYYLK